MGVLPKEIVKEIIEENNFQTPQEIMKFLKVKNRLPTLIIPEMAIVLKLYAVNWDLLNWIFQGIAKENTILK